MLRGRPRKIVALLLAVVVIVGLLPLDSLVPPELTPDDNVAAPGILARSARAPAVSHQVYGYLPYWQLDAGTAKRLDYRILTTIAFFGIGIRSDGNLDKRGLGYMAFVSPSAVAVTNAAHVQGVRIVPTFQLFDSGQMHEMRAFLGDNRAQQTFIKQAVDLIVKRRADGANLDFEPMPEGLSKDFTTFVARFRTAMRKRLPRSTLVVALEAAPPTSLIRNIVPHVDQVFIMAYDYRTKRSGQAGAVAPLDGRWGSVRKHLDRYLRYAPATKLILGVPYYGYDWPVVKKNANSDVRRDPKFGRAFAVTYSSINDYLDRNPKVQVQRDPISKTPYFTYKDGERDTYRQVWYEDTHSLKAKYTLAVAKNLAGVGIWALDNDRGRTELWSVLRKTFGSGHNPILRGSVFHLSSRKGIVTADLNLVLINRGSIPERGRVDWVIRDARGAIVTKGNTTLSASAGRRAETVRHIVLGPARRLRAGPATFQMTYSVDGRKWKSPVFKFKQPY